MKKTITFNLPADDEEYNQALQVGKYYTAISDYAQFLQATMSSNKLESSYAKLAYDRLLIELKENDLLELFDVR